MDAGEEFEVLKRWGASAPETEDMSGDGPGMAATGGSVIAMAVDRGSVAGEPAPKKKRKKRYSGGPQAKRRVKQ